MAIVVPNRNAQAEDSWSRALAPIFNQLQTRANEQKQQQQNIAQGSILKKVFDEISQKGSDVTAIDLVRSLSNAQAQGVSTQGIEPYSKLIPKLVEQERKGKQFKEEQRFFDELTQKRAGGSPPQPQANIGPSPGLPEGLEGEPFGAQDKTISPAKQPIFPQTEQPNGLKPVYSSEQVDPRFYKKDLAKYNDAKLSAAEKGFKRNEKFLNNIDEQSAQQPFIQDSIRQAMSDVQSGNTSGILAALKSRLGNIFPSIQSAEERNFENSMKNIALEQFASTPGFRSQGEFFVLKQVVPRLGDRKKAQELNLKAILDASLMRSREAEVTRDLINSSPNNEVPLNIKDLVNEKMEGEWKKLYARRYAEDPEIWDKYVKENPNDPLFKNIRNVKVPNTSINWKEYTKMRDPEGTLRAIRNDEVDKYVNEGWEKIQ